MNLWSDWKTTQLLPDPGEMGAQRAWVHDAISGLEHEHQAIQSEAWRPKQAGHTENAIKPEPAAEVGAVETKRPTASKNRKR